MYKKTQQGWGVIRLSDGAFIPEDDLNRDWQEFKKWRADGNIPSEFFSSDEAKAVVWEKIKALRDAMSDAGGYKVSVSGVDKWFHSDPKSKTQQLALARKADKVAAAGGDMNAPFPGNAGMWKTMDGTFVPMTPALALAIADAAEVQDGAIFAAAEQHKQAMMASSDPLSYDFKTTGWPTAFGG